MINDNDRKIIEEEFEKWARINNVEVCPATVISYLYNEGMINEKALFSWVAETKAMERAYNNFLNMLKHNQKVALRN